MASEKARQLAASLADKARQLAASLAAQAATSAAVPLDASSAMLSLTLDVLLTSAFNMQLDDGAKRQFLDALNDALAEVTLRLTNPFRWAGGGGASGGTWGWTSQAGRPLAGVGAFRRLRVRRPTNNWH